MSNLKVVDADALDAKFTSIADAVRSKTGKTELIPDSELAAEIESISGGGGTPLVTTSVIAFVPNIPKAHVNVMIDIENLISTSVTGEATK